MRKKKSSFDRVKAHLLNEGHGTPASGELHGDLDMIVRRCNDVRSLGREYGGVELSPYMSSLLRVSTALPGSSVAMGSRAAASV